MELYEEVKDEIPADVGVYVAWGCKKRAKRRELGVDEQILKDSMIRSLYREAEKLIKSSDPLIIQRMDGQIKRYKKEAEEDRKRYRDLNRSVIEKFGYRWDRE